MTRVISWETKKNSLDNDSYKRQLKNKHNQNKLKLKEKKEKGRAIDDRWWLCVLFYAFDDDNYEMIHKKKVEKLKAAVKFYCRLFYEWVFIFYLSNDKLEHLAGGA